WSLWNLGHVVPIVLIQVISASIFGLIAGYIYQETKSLAGPVVIHNLFDGLSMLSLFIFYWTM
ncbi:MAG: CPBP family intramembrane metalloprotease, partial [Candidatus Methanolliviera hydrocarbonicum]